MTEPETTIILTKLLGAFPTMTQEQQDLALKAMLPYSLAAAREASEALALGGKWFAVSDFATALRKAAGERFKSPGAEAAERQMREYATYREQLAAELEAGNVKSPDQLRWEREFMAMTDEQQAAYIGAALDFMGTPSKQRGRYEARSVEDWLARPAILQAYAVELRRLSRQGGVL
jgi:hypothetical protein